MAARLQVKQKALEADDPSPEMATSKRLPQAPDVIRQRPGTEQLGGFETIVASVETVVSPVWTRNLTQQCGHQPKTLSTSAFQPDSSSSSTGTLRMARRGAVGKLRMGPLRVPLRRMHTWLRQAAWCVGSKLIRRSRTWPLQNQNHGRDESSQRSWPILICQMHRYPTPKSPAVVGTLARYQHAAEGRCSC